MRNAIAKFILILFWLIPEVSIAATPPGAGAANDVVTRWISNYRAKPDPNRLPAAVKALSQMGFFKDTESSGVYIGFIAGVLSANPSRAEELIGKMFPLPAADQWAVIRAIAYSGLPDWKGLLGRVADRMPTRKVMIDKYLNGELQTLDSIALERRNATLWDKTKNLFTSRKPNPHEVTFDQAPELLDTLWGFYFATGDDRPIARIVSMLPWSKERDSVDRLTVGSMAKYTLVSNAARDTALLAMLKRASQNQPKEVTPILKEVIEAAETMDTTRVRKEALGAIEELKRKGPASRRDISTWGQIGQGALALGCIAAATMGQVQFGIPCVVGGAASSAVLNFWNTQP